jgi:hypothetical protein
MPDFVEMSGDNPRANRSSRKRNALRLIVDLRRDSLAYPQFEEI